MILSRGFLLFLNAMNYLIYSIFKKLSIHFIRKRQ